MPRIKNDPVNDIILSHAKERDRIIEMNRQFELDKIAKASDMENKIHELIKQEKQLKEEMEADILSSKKSKRDIKLKNLSSQINELIIPFSNYLAI